MAEKFPHKREGDLLGASHVNEINKVCKFVLPSMAGNSKDSISAPPFRQWTLRVTEQVRPNQYRGHRLWYSFGDDAWKITDTVFEADLTAGGDYEPDRSTAEKEWDIDASGIELDLEIGDKVICYWDSQRGMFIPIVKTGSDYKFMYFELKTSIAPNGNATAYRLKYDGSNWLPDVKWFDDLFVNVYDTTYVSSLNLADADVDKFEGVDIGETLNIVSGDGFTVAEYTVENIIRPIYHDLQISSNNTKHIYGASRPFTAVDIGLTIEIVSGVGFTFGVYSISDVDVSTGIATLETPVGVAGSTGGRARLTPLVQLSSSAGAAGSRNGHGFLGAFSIYEEQGIHRGFGIDDISDPVNHLYLPSVNPRFVANRGTAFTSDDIGKELTIVGGDYFYPGVYLVSLVSPSGWVYLDRECASKDYSSGGYGTITKTAGAKGFAQYSTASEHWEILTMLNIAKIARCVLAEDLGPTDATVEAIDFETMDGGQNVITNNIIASYTDIDGVEGTTNQIVSNESDLAFTEEDEGLVIIIESGTGLTAGNYVIESVDGSGNATLDRNCVDETIGGGEGDFSASGSTQKPLTITNDDFSILAGTTITVFWDETNDVYRIKSNLVPLFAKLDGALSGTAEDEAPDSALATIWNRASSSTGLLESKLTVTVYSPPFLGEDETINAGNWVLIQSIGGILYVIGTTGEVLTECVP